eukprot:UN00247
MIMIIIIILMVNNVVRMNKSYHIHGRNVLINLVIFIIKIWSQMKHHLQDQHNNNKNTK